MAVGGQPESARRGGRGQLRGAGVRRALGDVDGEGLRLCPSLVIVPPDFARYKAVSSAVFAMYREVTPLVEPLSLDEAYLDVTENLWGEPSATAVAAA